MSMLSLLARPAFLVTSPEGYTVVSYVSFSFFYQRKWLLSFSGIIHTPFIWNCLELDLDPLRGRVSSNYFKAFMGMNRHYLEKYILDHVLQNYRGRGIAVISLFTEGRKVKCISSRYSSLQRVIICIKVEEKPLQWEFPKIKGNCWNLDNNTLQHVQ